MATVSSKRVNKFWTFFEEIGSFQTISELTAFHLLPIFGALKYPYSKIHWVYNWIKETQVVILFQKYLAGIVILFYVIKIFLDIIFIQFIIIILSLVILYIIIHITLLAYLHQCRKVITLEMNITNENKCNFVKLKCSQTPQGKPYWYVCGHT